MSETRRRFGSGRRMIGIFGGMLGGFALAAAAQEPPARADDRAPATRPAAVAPPAHADGAATAPDADDDQSNHRPEFPRRSGGGPEALRRGGGGMPGAGMPRGGPGGPQRPFLQAMTPEEYDRATAIMREHMPNVLGIWESLPERFRQRREMPPRLAVAFRLLMEAEDRKDAATADLLTRQLRLRDEFLGDLIDLRRNGNDRMQIREALREKTREIVQANLEQRELRLKQMEERLAAERQKLARERENPDQLVEGQLTAMMEESAFFLQALRRQWGGPGSPGGFGGGPTTLSGDPGMPDGTTAFEPDRPTAPPRP